MADLSFVKTVDDAFKTLIYNKFKTVMNLGDSQNLAVVQEKPNVALRKRAEKKGYTSTDFISIWRENLEKDRSRQSTYAAREGLTLNYQNEGKSGLIEVKAVPVNFSYSVRFWSTSLDKVSAADELFLFWQHNNPNLIFNYLDQYPLSLYIQTDDAITDESTFDEQYEKGLYVINKANVTISGWIFNTFITKTILDIYLKIYSQETIDGEEVNILLSQINLINSGS